jgi:hypothetical protein
MEPSYTSFFRCVLPPVMAITKMRFQMKPTCAAPLRVLRAASASNHTIARRM